MAMKARYTVVNGRVIAEKRNGVRRRYVADVLGSTVALLDNTQTQTDTFTYWPYGEEKSRTGTTPTPFRYVGGEGNYRDSANMTYVRARYLDTGKGSWLTPDPRLFWYPGTLDYVYGLASPTDMVDRNGLQPRSPRMPGVKVTIPDRAKRGYGQYCGWDRNPWYSVYGPWPINNGIPGGARGLPSHHPVQPGDWLDWCCIRHDHVYHCHQCPMAVDPQPQVCRDADADLCACTKRINCSQMYTNKQQRGDCDAQRADMIAFFCYVAPALQWWFDHRGTVQGLWKIEQL